MGALCFEKNDTNTTIYSKKLLDLLKEILKNRILSVDEFRKLDFSQKYLCYQNKYLSDNEIRIGNEYSKWKYPTNSFLLIDSNIIQLFSNASIIDNDGMSSPNSPDFKINFIETSETKLKDGEEYLCWIHGCTNLTKQLASLAGNKRFIFVNNNYHMHWNFLFGFYENKTNENGDEVKLYLLDSMNVKNKECTNRQSTTISESNTRLLTLVKLIKLFLFVNKYSTVGKEDIILDKENNSIFIHKNLQSELISLFSINKVNYVYVSQQNDGTSCGLHIVHYFHSVLKLIHKIESPLNSKVEAGTFDTQLRSLKAFKHHPKEYRQIRSDLLNFTVNLKFFNKVLKHKILKFFSSSDFPIDKIRPTMRDFLGKNTIETLTLWFPALVIVAKMAANLYMVCFCCQNGNKNSFTSNFY